MMDTTKKTERKKKPWKTAADVIREEQGVKESEDRPKSKVELFREKYPHGILEIVDMDAILK
jgi:hypothetical protein